MLLVLGISAALRVLGIVLLLILVHSFVSYLHCVADIIVTGNIDSSDRKAYIRSSFGQRTKLFHLLIELFFGYVRTDDNKLITAGTVYLVVTKSNFEQLAFNTAISQMMIFVNAVYKNETCPKAYAEGLIKMLSCISPHIGEEIWSILGHDNTIAYEKWPEYDEAQCKDDTVEIGVQVNGKVRGTISVNVDEDSKFNCVQNCADVGVARRCSRRRRANDAMPGLRQRCFAAGADVSELRA